MIINKKQKTYSHRQEGPLQLEERLETWDYTTKPGFFNRVSNAQLILFQEWRKLPVTFQD